jgi:phosphatidylcholine synthase
VVAGAGRQRLAAAAVHAYTASGVVLALLIVEAAYAGNATRALWLLLAALVIDGTDGMLARRFRVKERLPGFDGALLDNIVDYLTYAFAPVLLLLSDGRLPAGTAGTLVAAVPLLASSYQFCRSDAKTDDHLFRGFPSYWNVVAFYAVVMDLSSTTVVLVLLVCSALVLAPIGCLYPSRTPAFRSVNLALTGVWLVAYAALLLQLPEPAPLFLALSLGYVVYYTVMSLYLTATRRRAPRGR